MEGKVFELLVALDDYLEYSTYSRFVRLLRAKKALQLEVGLDWELGPAGWRMLVHHQEQQAKVSGKVLEWPEDL